MRKTTFPNIGKRRKWRKWRIPSLGSLENDENNVSQHRETQKTAKAARPKVGKLKHKDERIKQLGCQDVYNKQRSNGADAIRQALENIGQRTIRGAQPAKCYGKAADRKAQHGDDALRKTARVKITRNAQQNGLRHERQQA